MTIAVVCYKLKITLAVGLKIVLFNVGLKISACILTIVMKSCASKRSNISSSLM